MTVFYLPNPIQYLNNCLTINKQLILHLLREISVPYSKVLPYPLYPERAPIYVTTVYGRDRQPTNVPTVARREIIAGTTYHSHTAC